jgi:hypothetical protein
MNSEDCTQGAPLALLVIPGANAGKFTQPA